MSDLLDTEPTLLIIDDDPDTIQILSSILAEQGRVLFATSGEQGMRMAENYCPDVILLDQNMPGQNGYETCLQLKRNPATQDACIVFVTAQSEVGDELRAFEAGAQDFISKPFSPVVVNARIRNQLTIKRQSDTLKQLADLDGLTGVFNRRYFNRLGEVEVRRHYRQGFSLAVALVDVDHFKAFNDLHGHVAGDDILRDIAQALNGAIRRPGEFAARYGGEEFVVVMPYTTHDQLDRVGEWLCSTVRSLAIQHGGSPVSDVVTASIGLAAGSPGPDTTLTHYVQQADTSLYNVKQGGRNGFKFMSV